jgi:NAD(P)H-hydrate epimerase
MMEGVWPLVGASEMRELDRHTIEDLEVGGEILMESAGRAVAECVLEQLALAAGAASGGRAEVCVVCGTGNNGGDGFVVARHLDMLGVPVRVALLGQAARVTGDAASNLQRIRRLGVSMEGSEWTAPAHGVIVDAIFGTGLTRDVKGAAAESIARINAARSDRTRPETLRVVAVDLPSGLDSDTGQVLGTAVEADVTVTIALPKLGLVLEPGRSRAGQVQVARIGIADKAPGVSPRAELWLPAAAGARLPHRPSAGHKGSFGHVLLVAGGEGKTGAAALAACGAGRAGAGLVTVACPAGLNDILEVKCTEAMTAAMPDTAGRELASKAEEPILALVADRDVVAMGPGVGRGEETQALMRSLARRIDRPLVIDADALYAFGDEPERLKTRAAPTVLTPHPGEAARLLGRGAGQVNRDRVGSARQLALATGAVVLLKGAASVTADPEGRVVVNPTGSAALATGGTGDVLTGMVVAYLAQGLPPLDAAALAAYVHGAAADRLSREIGAAGLLAGDVARELPATTQELRQRAQREGAEATAGVRLALPVSGT